ncbi:MAG: right-handed parallel beta-helix repeat-containing protein [Pirellulales bacterium]|nr:right-handed parallel beta-helix repeat-containing protein [Pirellulales bacterium]
MILKIFTTAAFSGLLLALGLPAAARDLYVNNVSGDDLFDGLAAEWEYPGHGPNQTIWRALRSALPGDHINLAKTSEPYRESISLVGSRRSGHVLHRFVLEGSGATLDGSRLVPPGAWRFVRGEVFRFQPERMDFQQLFRDGLPLVERPYSSIFDHKLELDPLQWALADGWIYFRAEKGRVPQDYRLSYASLRTGITAYQVEGIEISNLIVQGFQLDGIHLNDAVGPSVISGVIARGNGRSGIAVSGVSDVVLEGCLLGDNGHYQLLVQEFGKVNLLNCNLLDNTGPKWKIRNSGKLRIDGEIPMTNSSDRR